MVVSDTIIIFFEVGIFYVMDFIFYSPVWVQDKFLICPVPTTLAVAGKYRAT